MKEVVLTKEQFLALAKGTEVEGILQSIYGNPKTEITLETDLRRGFIVDEQTISSGELAEISKYYSQNMLKLISIAAKAHSENDVYPTRGQKTHIIKENGKIILRQIFTDPTFIAEREWEDPLHQSIPGTIATDFIFQLGKGFELDKVTFSNEVLYKLIKSPPRKPTEADLKKLEQEAATLDAQKSGPRVITEEKTAELFRSRKNSLVLGALSQENQSEQPASIAAQILADKTNGEISIDLEDMTREEMNGGTLLRTTLKNPIFTVGEKLYEIPGTITTDYIKKDNHYKFKEMTISNSALHRLILNPPLNPTANDFREFRTNAALQESRGELLQAPRMERNTDIALSKQQILELTGKKSLSHAILEDIRDDMKGSATQFEKDKRRGLHSSVSRETESAIALYYRQEMLSLPNYILMDKSQEVSLAATLDNYRGEIFTDKQSGKIMLRVELTDPLFVVSVTGAGDKWDKDESIQSKIAGKITFDYVFDPLAGFELQEMRFSNKVLHTLVTDPPKSSSAENTDAFKESFRTLQWEALKEEHQKKSATTIIPSAHSPVMPKGGTK